ncbi:CPBP family intramembrane metalloprotease [Actinotalea sp. AC32]|nr:CPBP family intramembrane metalloprotease [Actinotalea sp. AC32]
MSTHAVTDTVPSSGTSQRAAGRAPSHAVRPAGAGLRVAVVLALLAAHWAPWVLLGVVPSAIAWTVGPALFAAAAVAARGVALRRGLGDLGTSRPRTTWLPAAALLLGGATYGLVTLVRWAGGALEVRGVLALWPAVVAIAAGLAMAGYQAVGEELVVRGALGSVLPGRWRGAGLLTATTAAFVLIHAPRAEALLHTPYALHLVLAGVAFGLAWLRTGSIWVGAALHAGWNLGAWAFLEGRPALVVADPLPAGWDQWSSWAAVVGNALLVVLALLLTRRRSNDGR